MSFDLPVIDQDPLWKLTAEYRADARPEKLDLLIGVYRDDNGNTPTMDVVHEAEMDLARARISKSYRSLSGHDRFNQKMAALLLGEAAPRLSDAAVIQTVGGTGALRILGEMIAVASPKATVWSSDPGYVNHRPILAKAGLAVRPYRLHARTGAVDTAKMLDDLAAAAPGDVVLLHGCCHNPTGLDMDIGAWTAIADLCAQKGLIPFVDMAYQGFGLGLDADAAGLRLLVSRLDTVLVAASCSKNMGLYCERTGAAIVVAASAQMKARAVAMLEGLGRVNYSMPPDHGAAVASRVLADQASWQVELDAMRARVVELRTRLADRLMKVGASSELCDLRHHRGMFSTLPLSPDQMLRLRREFAIYGTDSGRINVAGLSFDAIESAAQALVAVSQLARAA